MLGGMFGVGIVLVRTMMNRGVENPDDIERLGLPAYAGVPQSETQRTLNVRGKKRGGNKQGSKLLAVENPADLAIEALRSLRTSLHFGMMDAKNNVLMISGPSPKVGESFVSTNLAAVVALADQKVLLIDADMRKGLDHEVIGLPNDQGLSEILSGQNTLDEVLHTAGVSENLHFVSRGTIPPNPSELLIEQTF